MALVERRTRLDLDRANDGSDDCQGIRSEVQVLRHVLHPEETAEDAGDERGRPQRFAPRLGRQVRRFSSHNNLQLSWSTPVLESRWIGL
uniref:Uncharacterized protein n=1 Tax=Burkholderia sp. M701 TaxID=326454 RepID=V5YPH8_9BURK|nr:hypothetical protein [Burkholderia sp. M701]